MARMAALFLFLVLAGLAAALVRAPSAVSFPPQQGLVQDSEGPVEGARVRFKGDPLAADTDSAGRFQVPASPTNRRLTAWKEGYFIAGGRAVPSAILQLTSLPLRDHADYEWVDPTPQPEDEQRCGNCHAHIQREWAESPHARSATGKHFRNLYDGTDWFGRPGTDWSLLAEHPDGAGVCSSCHAPTVRDDDPALFDLRQVKGVDAHGVHCDYCHKINGLSTGQVGLAHGRFLHRLLRPEHGQLFFGPLDDVDRGEDAYSPFYRDSRYCAACHEGIVFGVHVYSTYSEWLQSPAKRAGRHCQDCHMRPTGRLSNIAPGHGGIQRNPFTLANHVFWDGSQEQMLRRCLQLTTTWSTLPEGIEARVALVANGVGHRVPTGFIDRQLILIVEGFSTTGQPIALRAGSTLSRVVGPSLAGKPGRLYARLLADEAGTGPVPFWRATAEPIDTRLKPGVPDVRVFRFAPGMKRLRLRVVHRRFWAEVARRKRWPDRDLVIIDRTIDLR